MAETTIRPALPDPGGARMVPDPTAELREAFLRLDPAAGEAVWRSDRGREPERRFRLGDGPGELAGLAAVSYRVNGGATDVARLLLVDGAGRVLASSRRLPTAVLDQVWSPAVLEPAARAGLQLSRERFATSHRLQRRHPGAAKGWVLTSTWSFLLLVAGGAVVLTGALLLAIGIANHWFS